MAAMSFTFTTSPWVKFGEPLLAPQGPAPWGKPPSARGATAIRYFSKRAESPNATKTSVKPASLDAYTTRASPSSLALGQG